MSRWNQIRRRVIGPVMFLGGIGLLVQQTCTKQERNHATIVLDLGDAEPRVHAVDAELIVDGESLSSFHRRALTNMQIGPCTFAVAMPSKDGELRIDVELETTRTHIVRHIHAEEGATVHVPLAAELPAASAP